MSNIKYRQTSNIIRLSGHCSIYIFILGLTPGVNILHKDCNTRGENFQFGDLVWLILEIRR